MVVWFCAHFKSHFTSLFGSLASLLYSDKLSIKQVTNFTLTWHSLSNGKQAQIEPNRSWIWLRVQPPTPFINHICNCFSLDSLFPLKFTASRVFSLYLSFSLLQIANSKGIRWWGSTCTEVVRRRRKKKMISHCICCSLLTGCILGGLMSLVSRDHLSTPSLYSLVHF